MTNWVTPFTKQCFVVAGICLSGMSYGAAIGEGTLILMQLKGSTTITLDDESTSTIASIMGIALLIGAVMSSVSMIFFGRRTINLVATIIMIAGWLCIATATSVTALIIGRFCQGFSMGLITYLAGVLIGEYSSPKCRGALLPLIPLMFMFGILFSHFMGSFLSWWVAAFVCFAIALLDLLIIMCSPESPYYLVEKGKYDEARKAYHWLRGLKEEEEIERLIKTHLLKSEMSSKRKTKTLFENTKTNLKLLVTNIKRKEIYKPTIIMIHFAIITVWTNLIASDTYGSDVFGAILSDTSYLSFVLVSMDILTIISNLTSIYLMTKIRRRIYFLTALVSNVVIFLVISAYIYSKTHYEIAFDHPAIGVILIYIYIFIVAAGSFTVTNVINSEIIPLEYKGAVGLISVLVYTGNLTIDLKYAPYMFASIGVYGFYTVSAGILTYCLVVVWSMLPETKNKTLQEIQDAFRGSSDDVLLKSAAPITS